MATEYQPAVGPEGPLAGGNRGGKGPPPLPRKKSASPPPNELPAAADVTEEETSEVEFDAEEAPEDRVIPLATVIAAATATPKATAAPKATAKSKAKAAQEVEEAEAEDAEPEEDDDDVPVYRPSFLNSSFFRRSSSCTVSIIVHVVMIVGFGLWVVPAEVKRDLMEILAPIPEREEELDADQLMVEVEASTTAANQATMSAVSSSMEVSAVGGGTAGSISSPSLDAGLVAQSESEGSSDINVESPTVGMLPSTKLVKSTPDGLLGDPRAIVTSYAEAMDRITQELMWMLSKSDVLVVWAFDESESMKDDQIEIRDRVDRVYTELGLTERSNSDAITTGIVSYGEQFHMHTRRPTHVRSEIRAAIDAVPIDHTGKEMMCEAIGSAINAHRDYAKRTHRQMALIVVTDESGDPDTNFRLLEQAISIAKSASCRVYMLGREANFGYPYAFMSWVHPQTMQVHWLQIDRGPESAFFEQLQTNGFHRRYDAFSSGFGPYEETRITRETNGIFFMLPSVEKDLVGAEKRRYELEAMRAYNPDLRSRPEVFMERDKFPLRALLWKVANDLNPYNAEVSKIIEMRMQFSTDFPTLVQQARTEQQKAIVYLTYLDRAQKEMEKIKRLREQETSPRWQGNYDLMYAQLIAYQARIYEYGAYLELYLKNPKTAPAVKPPNLTLIEWDMGTRAQLVAPQKSQPYIDKATALLQGIIKDHPGTPWAARAQWELNRGFGVELYPDYHPPYPTVSNPIPVPKL